jgi:integrase
LPPLARKITRRSPPEGRHNRSASAGNKSPGDSIASFSGTTKYLPERPKFRMLREPVKLATFVSAEHFAAIYEACDAARRPSGRPYPAADYWRALLSMLYMTGWRISEALALRWSDVDLKAGTAITRAADNKGNRDDVAPLHPVVVDHLRGLHSFDSLVFKWSDERKELWNGFGDIQRAAGIHLPCDAEHEHTPSCHTYGFHDLRRAFATVNAASLSADALQKLMRRRSYSTTQRYINMADQLNRAVDVLHVPGVLQRATGG